MEISSFAFYNKRNIDMLITFANLSIKHFSTQNEDELDQTEAQSVNRSNLPRKDLIISCDKFILIYHCIANILLHLSYSLSWLLFLPTSHHHSQ